MKQAAYDAIVAERANKPAWPSEAEAKAYLTLKGFTETEPGKWAVPADHALTAKQAECLRVLGASTVKAHGIKADAGKYG